MKSGTQKTECRELSDAELDSVVGGSLAQVAHEIAQAITNHSQTLQSRDKLGNTQIQQ